MRTKQEKGRFVQGSREQKRNIAYVFKVAGEKTGKGHVFTKGSRTKQLESICLQGTGKHNRERADM